jgi:hypothetical protein
MSLCDECRTPNACHNAGCQKEEAQVREGESVRYDPILAKRRQEFKSLMYQLALCREKLKGRFPKCDCEPGEETNCIGCETFEALDEAVRVIKNHLGQAVLDEKGSEK